MATVLRRARSSSSRSLNLLTLSLISGQSRRLSSLIRRSPNICSSGTLHSEQPIFREINSFLFLESRRGFAKGRKQSKKVDLDDDDDDDGYGNEHTTTENVNIGPTLKATAVSQMEAAIDALSRELAKLRTGRASPGMLDHIMVETAGVKVPLNRMAAISVLDSKTLSVTPYDPSTLKALEKAIISSPLGLNPKPDDQRLIAPVPPLTKEHVQAVCKVVTKLSEDVKQSIRRARQKGLDTMKKALPKKKSKDKVNSSFSEDDAKRLEKEIDDLTKKFIKSAEDMCKAKEKEIAGP